MTTSWEMPSESASSPSILATVPMTRCWWASMRRRRASVSPSLMRAIQRRSWAAASGASSAWGLGSGGIWAEVISDQWTVISGPGRCDMGCTDDLYGERFLGFRERAAWDSLMTGLITGSFGWGGMRFRAWGGC